MLKIKASPSPTFDSLVERESKFIIRLFSDFKHKVQGDVETCIDNEHCLNCLLINRCRLRKAAIEVILSQRSKFNYRLHDEYREELLYLILKMVPERKTLH